MRTSSLGFDKNEGDPQATFNSWHAGVATRGTAIAPGLHSRSDARINAKKSQMLKDAKDAKDAVRRMPIRCGMEELSQPTDRFDSDPGRNPAG